MQNRVEVSEAQVKYAAMVIRAANILIAAAGNARGAPHNPASVEILRLSMRRAGKLLGIEKG